MKNNKNSIDRAGQFWTPKTTVSGMCDLLQNKGGRILEPTAGSGHFIRALAEYNIHAVEIDETVIPSDIRSYYTNTDFLKWSGGEYDAIIGNPPYVDWDLFTAHHKTDLPRKANLYLHILEKCVKEHLAANGECVLLVPSSIFTRGVAASLRTWMCQNGAFTHVLKPNVKWEAASVSTLIIRWVKGATQGAVHMNSGLKQLVCDNGYISFIDYAHFGYLRDYFNIHSRHTSRQIVVLRGWTRQTDVVSVGDERAHIVKAHYTLCPLKHISESHTERVVRGLNDFFLQHDTFFRVDGRWHCGKGSLLSTPLDVQLFNVLQ